MPLSYNKNTPRKHTQNGRVACVLLFLGGVSVGWCVGLRMMGGRAAACAARFAFHGMPCLWHVCQRHKNTRSTFGTRRGRAFTFIHFARFFVSLFFVVVFFSLSFSFVPCPCVVIPLLCFALLASFLPSLFVFYLVFSLSFPLFVPFLVLSCFLYI